ncbi:MAG: thioesterase [Ignavibacteria bacterium]|nr:thioesterase [Ignavibacteria bacterium]
MDSAFEYNEYILNSNDVDTKERMTVVAVCNFMQNLAGRAAEKRGYGYTFSHENGLVWVLMRINLKILSYPKWNDKVILKTWVHGIDRIKTDRHFTLYNERNQEIAHAITDWVLIDYKFRRPQIIEKFVDKNRALDSECAKVDKPAKIQFTVTAEKCAERKIVYSDIDLNQHVNNIKYTEWFLDTYDFDYLTNHSIAELEMNFLSECRYGEEVRIFKDAAKDSEIQNIHYGSISRINDNKEVFRIRIKWNNA